MFGREFQVLGTVQRKAHPEKVYKRLKVDIYIPPLT